MKSALTTPASAAAITLRILAGATLLDAVAADTFPFTKPGFRYTPFQNLDTTTQTIAEEKLGYIELTWNNHGLAPVEKSGWTSLTSNERDGADLLGFSQERWDVSHAARRSPRSSSSLSPPQTAPHALRSPCLAVSASSTTSPTTPGTNSPRSGTTSATPTVSAQSTHGQIKES